MPNKLMPFSPEQNQKVADFLRELKKGFDLFKEAAAKPVSNIPDPLKATEANMRQSLLDQRASLMSIKSSLETIRTTVEHFLKVFPEGRKPLSLLYDWAKLGIRVFENLIEENLLWEKPDPTGYLAANRRRNIFSENRQLGESTNEKLTEGAEELYKLTEINILDWLKSE